MVDEDGLTTLSFLSVLSELSVFSVLPVLYVLGVGVSVFSGRGIVEEGVPLLSVFAALPVLSLLSIVSLLSVVSVLSVLLVLSTPLGAADGVAQGVEDTVMFWYGYAGTVVGAPSVLWVSRLWNF